MAQDPKAWRADWTVHDDVDGLGLPHAVHKCGLSFNFVYTELDDQGRMGWCVAATPQSDACMVELNRVLGAEGFEALLEQLVMEAHLLWLELGYTDASSFKDGEG